MIFLLALVLVRASTGDEAGSTSCSTTAGGNTSPLAREAFARYNRTLRPLVPAAQVEAYAVDGFTTLRGLLPADLVTAAYEEVEEVWKHYLLPASFQGTAFLRHARDKLGAAQDTGAGQLPFDRLYNLEQLSPALRRLVTLAPMADAVARVMNVSAVRLYMSSYFRKAAGDSASQWHKDEDAAPFVTSHPLQFATLWLPLASVRAKDGALMFAKGSHKDNCTYFACELPCETVSDCYETQTIGDLEPGDATLHTGRTFHFSHPNTNAAGRVRPAIAIGFVATGLKLRTQEGLQSEMLQVRIYI